MNNPASESAEKIKDFEDLVSAQVPQESLANVKKERNGSYAQRIVISIVELILRRSILSSVF